MPIFAGGGSGPDSPRATLTSVPPLHSTREKIHRQTAARAAHRFAPIYQPVARPCRGRRAGAPPVSPFARAARCCYDRDHVWPRRRAGPVMVWPVNYIRRVARRRGLPSARSSIASAPASLSLYFAPPDAVCGNFRQKIRFDCCASPHPYIFYAPSRTPASLRHSNSFDGI